MANKLKPRNAEIIALSKRGKKASEIIALLKDKYPEITRQVVHGARRRAGLMRPSSERDRSTYARGENAPHAKLTAGDVRWIRDHHIPFHPEFGSRALARKYGVRNTTIAHIVDGVSWSHLD